MEEFFLVLVGFLMVVMGIDIIANWGGGPNDLD